MKRYLLFFVLLIIPLITFKAEGWNEASKNIGQSITDIHMFDVNKGIACGGGGLIYKTNSGGMYWEITQSPVTSSLYAVTFVDNMNGYIGADKQLLVTKDGGNTWTQLPIAEASGTVKGLYFTDVNNGQALVSATSGGQIFKTTDGGVTWVKTLQASKDLLAFSFYSPTKGVATGKDVGTLYYTTDGNTWTNSPTPSLGGFNYTRSDIWGVHMVSENVAYGTGWGSRAAGLQPTIHIKTTNGGQTWEYQTLPENQRTYINFQDVYFKDENTGFCVGGSSSYEGGVIYKTTDGGINWEYVPAQLGFPISSIFANGDNLWVTGDAGCVAYSSNFGVNWKLIVPMMFANCATS
ncbi:MAG TPA: YCF48-related protein [Melioribacteraceae bacterium]|nr:YCF48-related protein [Melioribacteraceae bacterium]